MKLKSLELNEIGHIAESEIYRYIREIETNESQYLGGLLREIYEKSLQGMRFLLNFHLKKISPRTGRVVRESPDRIIFGVFMTRKSMNHDDCIVVL